MFLNSFKKEKYNASSSTLFHLGKQRIDHIFILEILFEYDHVNTNTIITLPISVFGSSIIN